MSSPPLRCYIRLRVGRQPAAPRTVYRNPAHTVFGTVYDPDDGTYRSFVLDETEIGVWALYVARKRAKYRAELARLCPSSLPVRLAQAEYAYAMLVSIQLRVHLSAAVHRVDNATIERTSQCALDRMIAALHIVMALRFACSPGLRALCGRYDEDTFLAAAMVRVKSGLQQIGDLYHLHNVKFALHALQREELVPAQAPTRQGGHRPAEDDDTRAGPE